MKDTLPPILSDWSGLPAPECCLANRSQARQYSERLQAALEETLSNRLNGLGSTIYRIGWKPHVTPLGRAISRQRASAPRTSGKEPISEPSPTNGWNTPRATDGSNGGPNQAGGALPADAALAGWPTCTATDALKQGAVSPRPGMMGLSETAPLAGWATASARDWKDSAGMATEGVNPDGSTRSRTDQLPRQAQLAGWQSPPAQPCGDTPETHERRQARVVQKHGRRMGTPLPVQASLAGWPTPQASDGSGGGQAKRALNPARSNDLMDFALLADNPEPVRFTISGQMLTGCSAGMNGGGQLNPRFSGWLMGYPDAWCRAALSCQLPTRSRKAEKTPAD